MKRILFFFNNSWAFGKIHNELIKVLWPEYYCDIYCWTNNLGQLDAEYMLRKYDAIVTTPEGAFVMHTSYGVPYDRCICTVHSYWDILTALTPGRLTTADFDRFLGYAVICPFLAGVSFSYGIMRVPAILPIGVFTENYPANTAQRLEKIGYFGRFSRKQNDHADETSASTDIKRGYLAEQVAEAAGVELVKQEGVHFLWSEGLYSSANLVIFCSLIEGLPTPAIESFAAGVPVLGTDTGIFGELAKSGGGGILPFEPDKFVSEAVEVISALKESPALYQRMSAAALQESKKYDWAVLKPTWLECLSVIP